MLSHSLNYHPYDALCPEDKGDEDESTCSKETFAAIASVIPHIINGLASNRSVESRTESPIEVLFGVAFIRRLAASGLSYVCCDQRDEDNCADGNVLVMPQYGWKNYRIDWAIKVPLLRQPLLFIECDGREFHCSDAQILRDKQKDRLAAESGIPMFRFSGGELDRNAEACARIVFELIERQYLREKRISLRRVVAASASRKCPFKVELRILPSWFDRAASLVEGFHQERGLDVRQGPSEQRYNDRREFVRWYFEMIDDAEAFRARFGGRLICSSAP